MDYSQTILTVNFSTIVILVLLAVVLLAATRFRGENGYAAAIIVLPNIPVYIYNMSRMLGWNGIAMFMFPLSYSVNTMLMPLLWLFTLRNFDTGFRLRPRHIIHFLPAIIFFATICLLPREERLANILHEASGEDMWVGNLNTTVLLAQVIGYFTAIFIYIRRAERRIRDNCSDAEWMQREWIPRFMALFAVLFVIVMVSYVIWPRTDAWLIQILNVTAMSCLVYNAIAHPVVAAAGLRKTWMVPEPQPPSPQTGFALDAERMKATSERIVEYLTSTQAYRRSDLSLAMLAREVGIPQKVLSRSINGYLNRNFFELVNEMRVGEAKKLLLGLRTSDYTVDSVFTECGFRSRSTFFLAFKKSEGCSPAQWLGKQGGDHQIPKR